MEGLLLPVARVDHAGRHPNGVPASLRNYVSGAFSSRTADDMAYAMGRSSRPEKPILLWGADGSTPIFLMGLGVTEVAEMEDMAMEALAEQEETYRKTGRGLDFEELREKNGLPRKEDVGRMMREAVEEKAARHQKNQRTNPARKNSNA